MFVVFEGGEGAGKTTAMAAVAAMLRLSGFDVLETREPGGTDLGKSIRRLLVENGSGPISPATEMMLFMADRAQHVEEVIRPALAAGQIVLCDRFYASTMAYQGYGRGLDKGSIRALQEMAVSGSGEGGALVPDLTILLDIDPDVGLSRSMKRLAGSNSNEGRFENEEMAFHQRVNDAFRNMAKSGDRLLGSSWSIIPAMQPAEDIADSAAEIIRIAYNESCPGRTVITFP